MKQRGNKSPQNQRTLFWSELNLFEGQKRAAEMGDGDVDRTANGQAGLEQRTLMSDRAKKELRAAGKVKGGMG